VVEPEAYAYDEEILRKAEELGYPGLITIVQNQRKFLFTVEGTGALRVRAASSLHPPAYPASCISLHVGCFTSSVRTLMHGCVCLGSTRPIPGAWVVLVAAGV
jgi:hypothetical protein